MSFVLSPVNTQLSLSKIITVLCGVLWVNLHFDSAEMAQIDDVSLHGSQLVSGCSVVILIDAGVLDASICVMPASVCSLCPGIDYKTTTILLDGRRVKLELW